MKVTHCRTATWLPPNNFDTIKRKMVWACTWVCACFAPWPQLLGMRGRLLNTTAGKLTQKTIVCKFLECTVYTKKNNSRKRENSGGTFKYNNSTYPRLPYRSFTDVTKRASKLNPGNSLAHAVQLKYAVHPQDHHQHV